MYSTEGAASVVPDRVSDIFMAAYSQLQGTDHKLAFFKLLVTEFGVQRECRARQAGRDTTEDALYLQLLQRC